MNGHCPALNFNQVSGWPVELSHIGQISAISCPFLKLSAGNRTRLTDCSEMPCFSIQD